MKTVFISGCYDILHAGHLQFFREARALGDHLTVCFASADVLWAHKHRRPSLPDEHKQALLESLRMVDHVVMGEGEKLGLDFEEPFRRLKPDILAVTEDDQYCDLKQRLCEETGCHYAVLPKTPPRFEPLSTTDIVRLIRAPVEAPLRVDFAGGWLDVPRYARANAWVVNCAISPLVSLHNWPYKQNSGLGGSGAYALLQGDCGVESEIQMGVGWQDPAIIHESGLCVWRSGEEPSLEFKSDGRMLTGCMALLWTGITHDTARITARPRNYDRIEAASRLARDAVLQNDLTRLAEAVHASYEAQLDEGMEPLGNVSGGLARKYCGSGWGGYGMILFETRADRDAFLQKEKGLAIEPYLRPIETRR